MKLLIFIFLAAVVCSRRASRRRDAAFEHEWEEWKVKHGKQYSSELHESEHKAVWGKNRDFVQTQNALYEEGKSSFRAELNHFSDVNADELAEHVGHHVRHHHANEGSSCGRIQYDSENAVSLPNSVDWRKEGYVTEVKNQLPQQCLHSVYFTVTGALEGQWFKKTGKLLTLSEQNLADCCGAGEQACSSTGTPCSLDNSYRFIRQKGIETLEDYPDTRQYQQCAYDPKKRVATVSGYTFVDPDEKSLQFAVATIGPISVAIDSSQPSFQTYSGGVYNEPKCSNTTADRNLLVVGYGTDPVDGDYWIAKNSWGTNWGEQGYIRLSRNKGNQCGIASTASYPFFSCDNRV